MTYVHGLSLVLTGTNRSSINLVTLQVFCEAEAFMEDVILVGLEMLSMDADLEAIQNSIEGWVLTAKYMDYDLKNIR